MVTQITSVSNGWKCPIFKWIEFTLLCMALWSMSLKCISELNLLPRIIFKTGSHFLGRCKLMRKLMRVVDDISRQGQCDFVDVLSKYVK